MTRAGTPVAIVGVACLYPDATSPEELFENVLAGRRAFRRIPDERLPLADYGSSDPAAVDATYLTQAALIEGYVFDRLRFKIVGSTYRSADLTHWIALDVADRALSDAGFAGGEGLPRDTTGVLLGNTLTGEFSRAQAMRLRWPYVKTLLADALGEVLPGESDRADFIARLEVRYKAPFEEFGDESLAGGLSNTIAGRICNYFDLHGGGYTLDGACSSSLLAVTNACNALVSGDLDVALAGGVDVSLDPFELVGFSRAGAFARNEMHIYDERSEGFWPGEGCGFVVLMREADALAQGRHVYARIRGWGISSDGAGGISRPEASGQLFAMRRAYARAGFGPETVGYFEGHGTGTVVGDATELTALTRLLREARGVAASTNPVPIGSVKANIGHTKAAAGVAGLIKAAMAVRQQIVPGMPGCEQPHERVDPSRGAVLFVPPRAIPWPADCELRAGISSMGFGGINAHIVIDASAVSRRAAWSARERGLSTTVQDAELFAIAAENATALRARVAALAARAASLSRAELVDLAATLAQTAGAHPARAAVIASRPDELAARLETLHAWLGDAGEAPALRVSATRGVFVGGPDLLKPRIGFLFPGQGAPVRESLGALGDRFPDLTTQGCVREYGSRAAASHAVGGAGPVGTDIAQPAIVAASLASVEALGRLGIEAQVAVGHSLGEISAICWAEALDANAAIALAEIRGQIMAECAEPGGTMATLPVTLEQARSLTRGEACTVAGHNGPNRCAISGTEGSVDRVLALARERGIRGSRLEVSHAFHSPLVAPCEEPLRLALASVPFQPVRREVVSTRTGALLERACDLSAHLVSQLVEPVRFAEALEKASRDVDLLIEVGPGRMLTGLASEFLSTPVIALDSGSASASGFLSAVGAAWALGAPVDLSRLFEGRVTKPLDLDHQPRFFANPAARPLRPGEMVAPIRSKRKERDAVAESALALVVQLVAERCELPPQAIGPNDRFLSDLHLTSIAVSAIASEAARELERPPLVAPNEFADATLAELAAAIDSDERVFASLTGVAGADSWVRAFEVRETARQRPRRAANAHPSPGGSNWQVFAAEGDAFAQQLADALRRDVVPDGVLVHLPKRDADANLPALLAGAKAAALDRRESAREGARPDMEARLFVLVHHGDPGVAVARSLHQEVRSLATRLIEIPADHPEARDWVVAEVNAAAGYLECRYDDTGLRTERRLHVLPLACEAERIDRAPLPLSQRDVLLVSGGGKGIAAECALALARESGCALGILGRSAPGNDEELFANLERFRSADVRSEYVSADVSDPETVARAIDKLEATLGPVSALLHGAGINTPAPIVSLEAGDFSRTLAPKLRGLDNLLHRLQSNSLRFVVGFGSVIAQIGLPGEADYAWANERMSRRLEQFSERNPQTRCLSLEWSIWSGVGMGERLGRVETLAAMNIAAISSDEGVAWLIDLLQRSDAPVRTFLSGRFGSPPTLEVEDRPLPLARFLERVREYTPGVELVVDGEISFGSDPYLEDHVYRGDAIMPGVIGLEAMAQVACALAGDSRPPVFERVEFLQAIDVPRGGKRIVRVAGLVRGSEGASSSDAIRSVELVVRSDSSDFHVNHLRAVARFEERPHDESESPRPVIPAREAAPVLEPGRELYGDLFFHGGRFERVLAYRGLRSRSCDVEIARRSERFFGPFQPPQLRLGDPGARDAAIHAIQACVPDSDLLPVFVERIESCGLTGEDPVLLCARERDRAAGEYTYDLELRALALDGEPGACLERWRGLRLREVPAASSRTSWPAGLLAPRLDELARACFGDTDFHAAVVPGEDRAASALAAAVALGAVCRVDYRPDGKPVLDAGAADERAPREVSASHAEGYTLAAVARQPVACDLEGVVVRDPDTWKDLLGKERERLAQHLADVRGEPFDVSATRVWGVVECLRKFGARRDAPLVLAPAAATTATTVATVAAAASPSDPLVHFEAGPLKALSLVTTIPGVERAVVITLLARGPDARL